jgi:hypothetical protein
MGTKHLEEFKKDHFSNKITIKSINGSNLNNFNGDINKFSWPGVQGHGKSDKEISNKRQAPVAPVDLRTLKPWEMTHLWGK